MLTITDSKTPVLEEAFLGDAAFVIALGIYQELPDEAIFVLTISWWTRSTSVWSETRSPTQSIGVK